MMHTQASAVIFVGINKCVLLYGHVLLHLHASMVRAGQVACTHRAGIQMQEDVHMQQDVLVGNPKKGHYVRLCVCR